jgi:spermidine/putrescine transport system permease protein
VSRASKTPSRARTKLSNSLLPIFVGLTFVFLYLPALTIIVYSFNDSAIESWPLTGFTFHWYTDAFNNQILMDGLRNSVVVAVISTGIALLIGVPAGFGFDRYDFPGKASFQRVLMLPFLMPGVISGLVLLTMFLDLGFDLSLKTVIIGHTTMLIAVFVIQVVVALDRWDRSLELAGMDLGAGEFRTFWFVILPNLRGTIFGACLLGVTISLDEIARTFFLTGQESTLPMVVWGELHRQITPQINAVGTVVLTVSLVALVIWSRFAARVERAR